MGHFGVANHASLKAYNTWAKRNPDAALPPPRDRLCLSFHEAVEEIALDLALQPWPLKGRTMVSGIWFDPLRVGYSLEELTDVSASERILREIQHNITNYLIAASHMRTCKAGVYFYEGETTEGSTWAVCLLLFRRLAPM